MATFHTNGRIISSPSGSYSADNPLTPQSAPSAKNNKVRTTYASKIVSKNKSSVTNESTASDQPQSRIDHISESITLNTLQQPQQKK